MQNFKKIYLAEVPQILIPKFFLDTDDEYRRSELRKTYKKILGEVGVGAVLIYYFYLSLTRIAGPVDSTFLHY